MGGVATPVVISGQSKLFRDNQSYSGTIWAKADFRDPSGTQVRNSDSGTVGNYASYTHKKRSFWRQT